MFQKPTLLTPFVFSCCRLSDESVLLLLFTAGLVYVAVDVCCCEPGMRSCKNCAAVAE